MNRLLLILLVSICVLPATCGTFVFEDLEGGVVLDASNPNRILGGCAVLACIATLLPPGLGYVVTSDTVPGLLRFSEEPDLLSFSDRLTVTDLRVTVPLTFVSANNPLGLCANVTGGCSDTDDPGYHVAGTITWSRRGSPNVVDLIEVQFVPEPSTLLLLFSGLLLLSCCQLGRRVKSSYAQVHHLSRIRYSRGRRFRTTQS